MVGDVANVMLCLAVFLLSWSSAEVTGQLRLVRCARRADQAGVTKRPINASLRAARLPNFLASRLHTANPPVLLLQSDLNIQ